MVTRSPRNSIAVGRRSSGHAPCSQLGHNLLYDRLEPVEHADSRARDGVELWRAVSVERTRELGDRGRVRRSRLL